LTYLPVNTAFCLGRPCSVRNTQILTCANGMTTSVWRAQARSSHGIALTPPAVISNVNAVLQPATLGRITGTVTAADTGLPLQNIAITASGPNGFSSVVTDDEGRYQFDGLPSGNYRLFFAGPGPYVYGVKKYVGEFYNNRPLDPLSPDVVGVTAPGTTANINAALEPAGAVVGRIIAADTGQGVPMTVSYRPGCQAPIEASGDPFTLEGLPSGPQSLQFWNSTLLYGQSAYVAPSAAMVNVSPANTTTITVTVQRGGQIDGRVVDENNQPISVSALAFNDQGGGRGYGLANEFTVAGLASGTYKLFVQPVSPGINYSTTFPVAMPIVTAPLTTTVGTIVLQRAGAISGQLVAQDSGEPIQGAVVSATRIGDDFTGAGWTDSDGAYTILWLQPGSYRVQFNLPSTDGYFSSPYTGGRYIPEFYDDQPTATSATPVVVPSSLVTVTGINASLQVGGRIGGKVVDQFGIAVPNVLVTVFDPAGSAVLNARTQGDGTYITRPGLPSGQYRVRFSYTACNGAAYGTVFHRETTMSNRAPARADGSGATLADATPINLTAGQMTRVDITIPSQSSNINGRVTENGVGVGGFKLTLTNATEATTDASGYYTFTGAAAGAFTISPSAGMSATTPASRNVSVPPDAWIQDFAVNTLPPPPQLSQIRGRVTRNGIGLAGFKLRVSDGSQVVSDANGNFVLSQLPAGTYTISPASGMSPTTPASRILTVPPDVASADFAAGSRVTLPTVRK